jgi:hypothetical protein
MLQNYTSNDLILYLYNETDLQDSVFIQKAIDYNEDIAEEFSQLIAVKQLIDDFACTLPRKNSVDAIMAYSELHASFK